MDYSKIKLENERNSHVIKRLNRLSTWKFFRVLFRENTWKMYGFSFLMLLCVAPIYLMQVFAQRQYADLKATLPTLNGFGFSTGAWVGVDDFFASQVAQQSVFYGLLTVAAAMLVSVIFCGGFAVIRDSFWTGKVSAVGVFRSIGKGFAANFLYALASTVIIAFSVFGIFMFYPWAASVMPVWLAIVLTVLLGLLDLLVVCYLMIVCSVSVTYKQSFAQNLADSWRLLWLNFLPNVLHLLIALLPIPLYFVFGQGMLAALYIVVMFMVGGLYFPLVWHTHMMRTFALFHPVESKKRKDVKKELQAFEEAKQQEKEQREAARKNKNKNKKVTVVKTSHPKVNKAAADQPAEDVQTQATAEQPVDVAAQQPAAVDEIVDQPAEDASALPSDK